MWRMFFSSTIELKPGHRDKIEISQRKYNRVIFFIKLDHNEGWGPKNWYVQTKMLEKTLESPLDCKESKPVNLKGTQPWILIGKADAKAETPIFWPPDVKN